MEALTPDQTYKARATDEREQDDGSTSTEVEGIVKKVQDLQVDEAKVGTLEEQGREFAVGLESDDGWSSGGDHEKGRNSGEGVDQVPGQLEGETAGGSTGQDAVDGSSDIPAVNQEEDMRMLDPEEGGYYLSDLIIKAFNRYVCTYVHAVFIQLEPGSHPRGHQKWLVTRLKCTLWDSVNWLL